MVLVIRCQLDYHYPSYHCFTFPPRTPPLIKMKPLQSVFLLCIAFAICDFSFAKETNYDIVIYGGTSGGVSAAIQAARMKKSVVLIEPTRFLGGLTTGGLGATDIGNKKAIGGISREFYQRVFQHYAKNDSWTFQKRSEYKSGRQGDLDSTDTMWTFEPSVATKIYDDMLANTGIVVVYGERLDLKSGVHKQGATISKIVMENGNAYVGKVYIDATYEGDLMAKAGVSYHVGRESNSLYGETINGLQIAGAVHHQFVKNVDAYVKPGDPSSGLLPGVTAHPEGKDGDGDKRIQAYNFRMCMTDIAENRRAWPKPDNYNELRYELLLRNFEAGDMRLPWSPTWMPNRKTDTNNNFAVSTDNIGMNYEYPDGDYAKRAVIWKEHEDYQKGLMWTLANHPRVPEKVREVFTRTALAKDEFLDNDNWPRQMYVREARRMVSEYVMSEKNCKREETIDDSVGMGAYNMDSHNTQRYVTKEGYARNEGDIQIGTRPYPISYRSIRPKADECTNLLVPVCLAASHIAYGSIRMEPVFMVTGQSAATAASIAIDENTTVQKISYEKLKSKLLEDNQVLDFVQPASHVPQALAKEKLEGMVFDDTEGTKIGFEDHSQVMGPFVMKGYVHDANKDKGKQSITFQPVIKSSGLYEVFLLFTPNANRATNVPVTIRYGKSEQTVKVNQRATPSFDQIRQPIGVFSFSASDRNSIEITNQGTDGYVVVDAIQLVEKKAKP